MSSFVSFNNLNNFSIWFNLSYFLKLNTISRNCIDHFISFYFIFYYCFALFLFKDYIIFN